MDKLQNFINREQLALFLQRAKEISILNRTRRSFETANNEHVMVSSTTSSIQSLASPSISQQIHYANQKSQAISNAATNSSGSSSGGSGSGRTFTSSRSFSFKCPLCSLVYRTQTFLNEHMRKEHSVLI